MRDKVRAATKRNPIQVQWDKSEEVNATWSIREKKNILKALETHGIGDADLLARKVETKNASQVKYFLSSYKKKTKLYHKNESLTVPVEDWAHKVKIILARKCDYSVALAEAVSKGSNSNKRHADVYQFLASLLSGEEPATATSSVNDLLSQLMQDLAAVVRSIDREQIHEFISTILSSASRPSEQGESSGAASNALSNDVDRLYNRGFSSSGAEILSLNPLKITPSMLGALHSNGAMETTENGEDVGSSKSDEN